MNKNLGIPSQVVRRIIFDILIERSNAIMDECNRMAKKELEQYGVALDCSTELGTTSSGTRVLADEIIEGSISLEEAVKEILTKEERKEAKARCVDWIKENEIER